MLELLSLPRLQQRLSVELPGTSGTPNGVSVAFSPDGKLLITGGYEPLRWSFDKLIVKLAEDQTKR